MKKINVLIIAALISILKLNAQNSGDALRYSNTTIGGTARSMSMGGAFGALGGDFSSLSINPAGLGVYKTSEFTFTPSIFSGKTSSTYNGTNMEDIKYNLNLSNAGMVLTYKNNSSNPDWISFSLGLGYNRTNNFNNQSYIEGRNFNNSLLDYYTAYANKKDPKNLDSFYEGLAYDANLIYEKDTINHNYTNDMKHNNIYGELQRKSITTGGSTGEFVLSMGANYKDKFYIGGTIGITTLNYTEQSEYQEIDMHDSIPFFRSLKLNEDLTTTGEGFNLKFGIIYRITDWVRIGAAFHSPTFYTMTDEYSKTMTSTFDSAGYNSSVNSPSGKFDYEFTTPMRAIGSIGFVIAKRALLSADYEFVDYADARFRSDNDNSSLMDVNTVIQQTYKATSNIKLGGEYKLDPVSFRAGFAYYGNPYKSGMGPDASRKNYTLGIGFREDNYFIDFSYVLTKYNENYYLYDPTVINVNPVKNEITTNNFLLTLGFKF
ncbi:MAG: outer membrane protein transport protein [Bacteroidota bacterium]|nr:outer membrane protein transport protein [Bacteroidota bacterium]